MTELTKSLQTMDNIVIPLSYGVSGTTLFLGLNVDEWGIAAAIVGIFGVLATLGFTVWFKLKYSKG